MNLLFLSFISTVVCILVAVLLKYLSLLHWVTGHAYVLSKRQKNFSIIEILDLFKNVRPFPISCQKGWKIDSYAHGQRVWFNFLTFPHNQNAPSIKVYAVFNQVRSTSQALLQLLKNISRSCEWKPGVISAASSHSHESPQVPVSANALPSVPTHVDCVKEEILCYDKYKFGLPKDTWFTENVVPTVTLEYKRCWHKEDNGVCWLLQMNEKLQTCEFYLIQSVQALDQCLLSVVTWSREHSPSSVDRASVLVSSLTEYISLKRLQVTPLTLMTIPEDLFEIVPGAGNSKEGSESAVQNTHLPSRALSSITSDSSIKRNTSSWNKKAGLEKYSSILRYGCRNEKSTPASASAARVSLGVPASDDGIFQIPRGYNTCSGSKRDEIIKSALKRSESDGTAVTQSRIMNQEIEQSNTDHLGDNSETTGEQEVICQTESGENLSEEDMIVAQFKTLNSLCASELLSETRQASDVNLELSSDQQAESSGGWLFSSFEKNIVVLKKVQRHGTTVQSYLGKGFILAPPKTVWDAVRNPRIRFTYDETLKKVDIIETVNDNLKIVYFYHESLQFLKKESFDTCVLHGERMDGQKYILTYSSIEHEKCPVNPNITRAKVLPSGWIIEPAKQDNRVYSIVTYLMQVDFDHNSESSDSLSFQEVISHYPLSIADLQQYLKPAVQMLRQKSVA